MALQNIFDNEVFFDSYKKLREREVNANILFEIPALFSLLPDLTGLRVLDLGCGFGDHCKECVQQGAQKVTGIDISEKMLEVAKEKNSDPRITYIKMPMEDLDKFDEEFDIVISSLALHYVEDFDGVLKNIHRLLTQNGEFIFSQEHPLNTCHSGDNRWTKDEDGNKLYLNLANYGVEGERESVWFVDNVKTYHRTFSTMINTLIDSGFSVERMIEPLPTEELLKKYPEYADLFHKPDFVLIKAKRRDT